MYDHDARPDDTAVERLSRPTADHQRELGFYAVREGMPVMEPLETPVGPIPLWELSAKFLTQILPLAYHPPAPTYPNPIDIVRTGPTQLTIGDRRLDLSRIMRFAWNAIMVRRGRTEGTTIRHAEALGLFTFSPKGAASPYSVWSDGVNSLTEQLNEAAGQEVIAGRREYETYGAYHYHVDPRVRLLEELDQERLFASTIATQLLNLGPSQTLVVPYDSRPPIVIDITHDFQIELGKRHWLLNIGAEKAFINLLRLNNGQPFLATEMLALGFPTNAATYKVQLARLQYIIRTLNKLLNFSTITQASLSLPQTPHFRSPYDCSAP
jgi:hypothetical protein